MAQTEFQRGAIWGINRAKQMGATQILNMYIEIPEPDKEEVKK